jgi:putative addiction module killer protein
MHYRLVKTPEYDEWVQGETKADQVRIAKRLEKIESEGHFGDHKNLLDGVFELKWENGRRIYYAYISEKKLLLLLGGNKNGQNKDISKAKNLLARYT